MKRWRASLLGFVVSIIGCCQQEASPLAQLPADSATEKLPALETEGTVVATDLFESVSQCDIYHRGVLLDLGSPSMQGRYGYGIFPAPDVRDIVREGATWARVESRSLRIEFHQLEEAPVFMETRIRGLGSTWATVRVDGKVLGGIHFRGGQIEVASTSTTEAPLSPGRHVVSLQFHRSKRNLPKAEIDWIRIGIPDNDPTTYGAPTLRDLAIDATIGGRPHKALAVRGPGRIRCAIAVREDMRLQTTVGYTGPGEGEAQIQLLEEGKPPYILYASKLGGEAERAEVVDLPLEGQAGRIVALDLVATKTSPGGRILFGDPVLRVRRTRIPARPKTKVVVLVVLTGARRKDLPPYEEIPAMAAMSSLAKEAVVFDHHRAPTTATAGSVASLLTGLSPAAHKVLDTGARLPVRFPTMGTIARDGRAATAMFTGNPTTFDAFGFARGWDRYVTLSPVSGTSARAPLREATTWMDARLKEDADRPLLVVVHARAGHPPWAAAPEQLEKLPPKDYTGNLNSRRGGQILAKLRYRHYGRRTITAQDRVRVDGFAALALSAEDELIGHLVELLEKHGVWDSTLLAVTSDVAMGGEPRIPFGDGGDLGEDVLDIPLVIRFPHHRFGGSRVQVPTSMMDITRTVLAAMALEPTAPMQGRDLFEVAAHPGRFGTATQFAFIEGRYATRWGDWLLMGASPRRPKFCKLAPLGTTCQQDDTEQAPFLASWLWRATYRNIRRSEASLHPLPSREPATLDQDTVAALTVWGDIEPKSNKK